MYNVIVVGTDGSDTAAAAVRHAVGLARLTGAKMHVVHAYQVVSTKKMATADASGPWSDSLPGLNKDIAADAELVCKRAIENAQRAGVEVESHTRPGDAADVLVAVAEEVGADLLVVGNRGMTGVRRFVVSVVPNKVSHHCRCSLLIVDTASA